MLASVAARGSANEARSLASDVGEMLMLGFTGNTVESKAAQVLAGHVAARRVGSVVFRKMNVGSRNEVVDLVRLLSPDGAKPLLAIDHEGGSVQRLTGEEYTRVPSALTVATVYDPERAKALYAQAATQFAATGFNLNLAPVVDLHDPESPAIGHFGRAFASDPGVVVSYAEAFIDAFASVGVHCAVKHFPGEGRARDDSHAVLPDVTATWSKEELEPYVRLIASGKAKVVMSGHVRLTTLEPANLPITLSATVMTGLLRDTLGFRGVAMTDDLDMTGVRDKFDRREAVIRAIAAGNDLLMICNTEDFDPLLPQHVVEWVADAIANGVLSVTRIKEAADRVRELRNSAA